MDQYTYFLDKNWLSDYDDLPSSFLFDFAKEGMRPLIFQAVSVFDLSG